MNIELVAAEEKNALKKAMEVLQSHPLGVDPQLLKFLEHGLQKRQDGIDPASIQHTYLNDYEIPQIVLFDILANQFPLVVQAQDLSHQLLSEKSLSHRTICIIDLGIGRGVQMVKMLDFLNEKNSFLDVHVLGIELSNDALLFTKSQLDAIQGRWKFKLHFHPIHTPIEAMDSERIQHLIPEGDCFLAVNASLALHHIQLAAERQALFNKIKSWNPDIFMLIEPNASTFTDNYEIRLPNACEHFAALFHFTNTLPLTDEAKRSLKTFFSNDFLDPVAFPDSHRFEKLERGEEWIERANECSLKTISLDHLLANIKIPNIIIEGSPKEYVNFRFADVDLLSIIAFQ